MSISTYLNEIVEKTSTSPAISVVASTGSGKSTQIPIALTRSARPTISRENDSKLTSRVFVSVPTILSARLLARYVGKLAPDKKVGFGAEGNAEYDENTDIVYATSGHIRKILLRYFDDGICNYHGMNFCDYLILDETHTGSLDNSVAIGLWNICYRSGVPFPHLILSSATPDESVYSSISVKVETITINLPSYDIDVRYIDEDFDLDDKTIYRKTAEMIASYHVGWPIEDEGMRSTFLVFVPGSAEAHTLMEYLVSLQNANILPAYSSLPADELNKVTEPPPAGKRNIIIATNIAESSVTIEDVSLIVDTLREKVAGTSESGGLKLSLDFAPQSSSKQRCGRTGRTRAGVCLRMCTKDFFDNLPQSRSHEMVRVPIYSQVIELLSVGLNSRDVLIGVDKDKVRNSILLLQKLKMLDKNRKVTDKGRFAPRFPLSVRNASVLWDWVHSTYSVFPGVVTTVLIDTYGPSYFWYPHKEKDETRGDYDLRMLEHRQKYFTKFVGKSDVHSFINIWSDLMKATKGLSTGQKNVSKWSKENSINNKKIKELIKNIKNSTRALTSFQRRKVDYLEGKSLKPGPFTTDGTVNAIRPMFRSSYRDLIFVNSSNDIRNPRRPTYVIQESGIRYNLDTKQAVNELSIDPPNRLIGLINTQIGNFRLISVALDLLNDDTSNQPKCPLSVKFSPKKNIQDRVNIRGKKEATTIKTSEKGKSGLDAIRKLREKRLKPTGSKDKIVGLLPAKQEPSACNSLPRTKPSNVKESNVKESNVKESKTKKEMSSVVSARNLCNFARTFNVDSISLDVGDKAIWDENFHLRQVYANKRSLIRPMRFITLDDRIIRTPDSENPSPTLKYQHRNEEIKTMDHWGQRKLFITELEFLTLYANPNTVVVYAGSAPGTHITYLAELFPSVHFHLFDERHIVATGPNIQTVQSLFTNDIADHYAKANADILFISDIRTMQDIQQEKVNEQGFDTSIEENVGNDMSMQEQWVRIIKPRASSLKFRLPWTPGKTKYLKGDIRPQPWVGATSSEARLIVTDSESVVEYDNNWYSDAMYYFNTRTRETFYEHGLKSPYDHCYDCNAEIIIIMQYLLRIEPDLTQDSILLLQRIQTMGDVISERVGPVERKTLKIE